VALPHVSPACTSASRTRWRCGARLLISLGVLTPTLARVRADEHGVRSHLLITRRLPWSEVLEVSFPDGSGARLELADDEYLPVWRSRWWTASARSPRSAAARAARALQHRGHAPE